MVVVDDGSTDATAVLAQKMGVVVVRHKKNKGQGAALRSGIKEAIRQGADVVVTFDADGQHHARDISRVVKPILEGNADVALGSRFLKKNAKMPFSMRIVLRIGIWLHVLLYGVKLTDVHNGFRAFSRKAAKKIKITCNRMEHASEIIEEIGKHKLRYVEVPVTISYTQYSMATASQSTWDKILVGYRLVCRKLFSKK